MMFLIRMTLILYMAKVSRKLNRTRSWFINPKNVSFFLTLYPHSLFVNIQKTAFIYPNIL